MKTRKSLLWFLLLPCLVLPPTSVPGQLYPPLVALAGVLIWHEALRGLLLGGLCGALLAAGGHPVEAAFDFVGIHLFGSLASPWKLSMLAFTLLLGGMAGLLEWGGGFQGILVRLRIDQGSRRRLEFGVFAGGLICFFDGLANSLLLGRVCRPLADRVGISRERLAYLVDATSSSVACVAFFSTWIVFQLGQISSALEAEGLAGNPYNLFFLSLPYNFYSWLTLLMVMLVIATGWSLGPMRHTRPHATSSDLKLVSDSAASRIGSFLMPVGSLVVLLLGGFVYNGWDSAIAFPGRPIDWAAAIGNSQGAATVMVLASALSCWVAWLTNRRKGEPEERRGRATALHKGVKSMVEPLYILVAAWILASTLKSLGTSQALGLLLEGDVSPLVFPGLVFGVSCLVAFVSGTSWGTMGLVTPLALPIALAWSVQGGEPVESALVLGTIGAVFGGAVFGDHCSPFSDTTLVSSVACGIEPYLHFSTQLPYALLTALWALLFGYLPFSFGMPLFGVWLLLLSAMLLLILPCALRMSMSPNDDCA